LDQCVLWEVFGILKYHRYILLLCVLFWYEVEICSCAGGLPGVLLFCYANIANLGISLFSAQFIWPWKKRLYWDVSLVVFSPKSWDSVQYDLKHITWVADLKCGIFSRRQCDELIVIPYVLSLSGLVLGLRNHGLYVVYIWKWISAHALGGVSGVTSFITTDKQLQ